MKLNLPKLTPSRKYKGVLGALYSKSKNVSAKKGLAAAMKAIKGNNNAVPGEIKSLMPKLRKVSPKAALAVVLIKKKKAKAVSMPKFKKWSKK